MLRRRVVLLGTGTNVGKTFLGAGLLKAWRRQGISTLGLKPVESGYDVLCPEASDAHLLRAAANAGQPPFLAFRDPVSPHLAARREGRTVDPDDIAWWVAQQEEEFFGARGRGGMSLIETAGGVFSPLNERHTNFDLARRLAPAVLVLVGPDALGVLHDVAATLRAMGPVRVAAVVLSEARTADASTGTNAGELERIVFPQLGECAPVDREVITLHAGDHADFLAERILSLCDAN